ncbi:MAG: OmpA family protein [Nannocystaceae bacterium]
MPAPFAVSIIASSLGLTTAGAAVAAPEGEGSAGGEASLSLGGGGASADASGDAKSDEKAKPAKKPKKSKKGEPEAAASSDGKLSSAPPAKLPWMKRYRPERNMAEIGVFGGLFLVSENHDFFDPKTEPQIPLWRAGPDVGARVAFFPLRFFGIEAEFAAMPTHARTDLNESVFLYGLRAHGVLQLPYRFTPFLLGGYGMMGVSGPADVIGKDIDGVGHYGGGLKLFLNKWLAVRVEGRHLIGAYQGRHRGEDAHPFTSHFEVLAGLSVTLGRPKPPKPPRDSDGDLWVDEQDKCPYQPGLDPDGCPAGDQDGDFFLDNVDQCPTEAGIAPDGCPIRDTDGDSFMDPDDKCPTEPGIAPDGCPIRDRDGDGILDEVDKCPDEPENINDYQDSDGCPDVIPEKVKEFSGVIEGIFFEFNSDKIRTKSEPRLKKAVEVLKEFPDIKVLIVGHTDNVGTREVNIDLSKRRAESVRKWLIDKGIEADRITTDGKGPDDPLEDNGTEAGRAKNRRIEFKVRAD